MLDLFAGTGQLGIECLSRGAATVHFFEKNRTALMALNPNVDMLGLPKERARVFKADVMKNPPLMGALRYDIVFLDPPYAFAKEDVLGLVDALKERGRLAEDAVISYEHDAADNLEEYLATRQHKMDVLASKRFGTTVIDLLQYAE